MAQRDAIRIINRNPEAFDTLEQKVLRKLVDRLYADFVGGGVSYTISLSNGDIALTPSEGSASTVAVTDLISADAGNTLIAGTDDLLLVEEVTVVSADADNDITAGSDGGAFYDASA